MYKFALENIENFFKGRESSKTLQEYHSPKDENGISAMSLSWMLRTINLGKTPDCEKLRSGEERSAAFICLQMRAGSDV